MTHEIYLKQLSEKTPHYIKKALAERDYYEMYGARYDEFLGRDIDNHTINFCFDGSVFNLSKRIKINVMKKEWYYLELDAEEQMKEEYVKLILNPVYED